MGQTDFLLLPLVYSKRYDDAIKNQSFAFNVLNRNTSAYRRKWIVVFAKYIKQYTQNEKAYRCIICTRIDKILLNTFGIISKFSSNQIRLQSYCYMLNCCYPSISLYTMSPPTFHWITQESERSSWRVDYLILEWKLWWKVLFRSVTANETGMFFYSVFRSKV